ncbi:MAG: MBL fold metallo-hydrolase [Pseudomonadota bacterium]
MFLLNRRTFLQATAAGVALGLPAGATPASVEVFTASPTGAFVDSVVVVGDQAALVIDAQLTQADATRLADQIAATGRRLETVFITHIHPDHLMGIAVLNQRFPGARYVAHPAIAEVLGQMGNGMFESLKGNLGFAGGDIWVPPTPLEGPLELEGETFDVLAPLRGDTALITPVSLPLFDTLVATDIVYNGVDLWLAETVTDEAFAGWRNALDLLEARPEGTIIPGHKGAGTTDDKSGIAFTRAALDGWEEALGAATDRASLAQAMQEILGMDPDSFFAQNALNAVYPE